MSPAKAGRAGSAVLSPISPFLSFVLVEKDGVGDAGPMLGTRPQLAGVPAHLPTTSGAPWEHWEQRLGLSWQQLSSDVSAPCA